MKVRLIVPRRPDGGERDRLWAFCRREWAKELPDFDIHEGEHADGPFNRSAAINAGAQGAWDVAVILDGDTIVDPGKIRQAVDRAAERGVMILPFKHRNMLERDGTQRILDGHVGSWKRWIERTEGMRHVSSCVVVPRRLWDDIGGFDERFQGWGAEDDAFHAACEVLGGVERLPGEAWHLWHETSPWRDHKSPLYVAACALLKRYKRAKTPEAMRAFLAESRDPDQIVVVCITNGKRPAELARTIASVDEMLVGPIGRKLIANSGEPQDFEGWEDIRIGTRHGYTVAVAKGMELAYGSGQPFVVWTEDDFVVNEPIDLREMQAIMDANPQLAQLALLRQAWYENEVEAGGIIEADPEGFEQRDGFVAHRRFWTSNTHLVRRSFLASHPWPRKPGSERRFGQELFADDPDIECGFLGEIGDPPRIEHIGHVRAGRGY